MVRLIRLLDTREDVPALAPLIIREIYYRLLKAENGWRLGQLAVAGSQGQRICRAIAWLREHSTAPLKLEDMARAAHMSVSSLHHHFKAVTAMSPLQYQKQLRLQEARRLLFSDMVDAAEAGYKVGYESPRSSAASTAGCSARRRRATCGDSGRASWAAGTGGAAGIQLDAWLRPVNQAIRRR